MFSQDKIHQQLSLFSNRNDQEQFNHFNILTARKNFKVDDELSEWRTSSYPVIPSTKKKHLNGYFARKNGEKDRQVPILPEQLSHRYTFLNQHSRNKKTDQNQSHQMKQPKIIELKLPRPNRYFFPNVQNKQQSPSRQYSQSKVNTSTSIYYLRHLNQKRVTNIFKPNASSLVQQILQIPKPGKSTSLHEQPKGRINRKRKIRKIPETEDSLNLNKCLIIKQK